MDLMRSAEGRRERENAEMRTEAAVSTKIWLVGALSLGLGVGAALGVLAYELKATGASYEYLLQDRQGHARHEDTARLVHVALHEQFQEWKETAIHGYRTVDAAKYSGQFRAASSSVSEMGLALQALVTDPAVREVSGEFLRVQSAMRNKWVVFYGFPLRPMRATSTKPIN